MAIVEIEIDGIMVEVIEVEIDMQQRGLPGLSAYELWISQGNTGSIQDFMDYLQQPATDAGIIALQAAQDANDASDRANDSADLADIATDNANNATVNVNQAISDAETATSNAETATDNANNATADAITATNEANTATSNADLASDRANTSADLADTATSEANTATANANQATSDARDAIADAETAITNAETATDNANIQADRAEFEADRLQDAISLSVMSRDEYNQLLSPINPERYIITKPTLLIPSANENQGFAFLGDDLVYPNYIKDGLVLHYDFGGMRNNDVTRGVARDLSGNGNDGELQNFEYGSGSGYSDNGLEFDGVDDYVELDVSPSLDNQELTFEIVCRVESIDRYVSYISARESTRSFMIIHNGTRITIQAVDTSTRVNINYIVQYGEIIKLTIVIKGNEVKVYAGKELIETGDWGYEIMYGDKINIGSDTGSQYFLDGNTYATRIYNRALTPEEIAHNYKIDKHRFNIQEI